ncbi:hypothetical protein N9B10_05820 [Pirellulales bacterium]|jgi:predicted nucleic acid-binding Zn ribbon protein|nr:hypothetical protein [Pirellulales bacterium]
MTNNFFHQHCPVCGRALRIEIKLADTDVVCQHCGGDFLAIDQKCQHRSDTILPGSRQVKIESLLIQGSRVIHSQRACRC